MLVIDGLTPPKDTVEPRLVFKPGFLAQYSCSCTAESKQEKALGWLYEVNMRTFHDANTNRDVEVELQTCFS
jgi:hypothetical protein